MAQGTKTRKQGPRISRLSIILNKQEAQIFFFHENSPFKNPYVKKELNNCNKKEPLREVNQSYRSSGFSPWATSLQPGTASTG